MFASVIPGSSPSDAQGALAILQVVSTDKRYKERLHELIKVAEDADTALANLHAAKKENDDKLAAAETMRAAIETEAQQILADAKAVKTKADNYAADLKNRENLLAADLNAHVADIKKTKTELAEIKATQDAINSKTQNELERRENELSKLARELDIAVGHLITNQTTVADIKGKIANLVK